MILRNYSHLNVLRTENVLISKTFVIVGGMLVGLKRFNSVGLLILGTHVTRPAFQAP